MGLRTNRDARPRFGGVWRTVGRAVVLAGVALADAQAPIGVIGPVEAAAREPLTAPAIRVTGSAAGSPDAPQSSTCAGTGVAVSNVTSGSTPSASSLSVSHTTSGTDRLMLVGVTWNKDGATNLTSVTYGGVGLTQVIEANRDTEVYSEIWRLIGPATGTANVVATLNGSSKGMVVGVVTFNEVHQSVPLGTAASQSGDASSGSITVSSETGGMVFDTMAVKLRTPNENAGQTERWTIDSTNENRGGGSTEPGAASVTMGWSWVGGSEKYAYTGVPIKACPRTLIGAAKDIVSITHLGSNVYRVLYDVRIENFGAHTLTSVQATDDLNATFAGPATFSNVSVSLQSGSLTVNGSYNGDSNTNLLSGSNSLTSGASGVVRITVDVDSQDTSGSYPNTANASGTGPDNVVVQDASEDGTDPDPDNDNDPTDNNTATPLTFGPTAVSINAFTASQRTLPGVFRYALLVAVPAAFVVRVLNRRRRGSTA